MQTTHSALILVAALVMLRHPCSRNKATARFILERAAEHSELTPAERDACRSLADELDNDPVDFTTAHCHETSLQTRCSSHAPNFAASNPFSLRKND